MTEKSTHARREVLGAFCDTTEHHVVPSVFSRVRPDMTIARGEIFRPTAEAARR